MRSWFFLSSDQTEKLLEWDVMRRPFLDCPTVAQRVAELTSSNDYVYIAGEEPQILYYARRRSPSRFIISNQLLRNTPMNLVYQQKVVDALKKHPPEAIVFERTSVLWGMWKAGRNDLKYLYPQILKTFLSTLLESGKYIPVGAFIQDKGRRYWQEPIDNIPGNIENLFLLKPVNNYQLDKSTLIIFRKVN
jgi:hypothetical protein